MTLVADVYPTVTEVEWSESPVPLEVRRTTSLYVMSRTGRVGIAILPESKAFCPTDNVIRPVLSLRNLHDVLVVGERIHSFGEYRDGWMGEGSKAPDVPGLTWLAQAFVSYFNQSNIPSVFLTPDGDVEMEWRKADRAVSLTVSPGSRIAEWYSFFPADNHDDRDYEETIELDREGWKRLNNLIQGLFSIE